MKIIRLDSWEQRGTWLSRFLVALLCTAAVFSVSGCSTAASLINGDVLLDSSIVEGNIRDGVLEQSGLVVEVECPDPMSGQVGDTRQCLAQDEFGDSYLVDVTIQNREGFVIWEIRQ
jgi:hypothetical protein